MTLAIQCANYVHVFWNIPRRAQGFVSGDLSVPGGFVGWVQSAGTDRMKNSTGRKAFEQPIVCLVLSHHHS